MKNFSLLPALFTVFVAAWDCTPGPGGFGLNKTTDPDLYKAVQSNSSSVSFVDAPFYFSHSYFDLHTNITTVDLPGVNTTIQDPQITYTNYQLQWFGNSSLLEDSGLWGPRTVMVALVAGLVGSLVL